jgi:hypothetical protein
VPLTVPIPAWTTTRRGEAGPDVCAYCGAPRSAHDDVAREWLRCAEKAAWFAAADAATARA